jgi:hypothetical protein
VVRGGDRTIHFKLRIPSGLHRGVRTIELRGADPDGADDLFGELTITLGDDSSGSDAQGPRNLKALVRAMRDTQRYDGLTIGKRSGPHAYRDDDLRLGGRVRTQVLVRR